MYQKWSEEERDMRDRFFLKTRMRCETVSPFFRPKIDYLKSHRSQRNRLTSLREVVIEQLHASYKEIW